MKGGSVMKSSYKGKKRHDQAKEITINISALSHLPDETEIWCVSCKHVNRIGLWKANEMSCPQPKCSGKNGALASGITEITHKKVHHEGGFLKA